MSLSVFVLCATLLQCNAFNSHGNKTSESIGAGHLRAHGGGVAQQNNAVRRAKHPADTSETVYPLKPAPATVFDTVTKTITDNGATDYLLGITFFVVVGACFLLDFTMLPSLNLVSKKQEAEAEEIIEEKVDVKSLMRRFEAASTKKGRRKWSAPSRKGELKTSNAEDADAIESSNQEAESHSQIPETVEAPVARLANVGRSAEAYRELLRLEKSSGNVEELSGLSREQLDALRRIGSVYESSLPQLAQKPSSYQTGEQNDQLKLDWGLKLEDGYLKVMCIQNMPDVDILKCVIAHAEKSLATHYDKDTIKAESLVRTFNDGLWRTILHTQSTGSKSDVISFTSAVDALDETLGSVWVAYYTSPPEVQKLKNVTIPPTLDGHFRTDKSLYVVKLKPLRTDGHTLGVQMTSILEVGVSPATYTFLSMMPGWALRRLVRGMVETAASSLVKFCRSTKLTEEFMVRGPSADFYQKLERHLEGPEI